MLTREAWNALLKILEEPPPRVIFVFATTEPQKIQQAAPPILSRCQRFDFHRISTPDLVGRLRTVMNAEGIHAGDDVLLPIAQKADGGMRDGLSLLDQVLSFTEGTPTAADVRRILGLVGSEVYLELFGILADRRPADVFRFVGRMLDEGYDLTEFYRGLADFIRALLIVRLGGGEPESVPQYLQATVAEMAGRFAPGDLLRMLAQVAELDADGRFRKSGEQRILIELLLLRFAYLESTVSIEDVLAALGGGGSGTGGDGGSRGNGGPRPAPESPAPRGLDRAPVTAPVAPPAASEPRASAPAPAAELARPPAPAPSPSVDAKLADSPASPATPSSVDVKPSDSPAPPSSVDAPPADSSAVQSAAAAVVDATAAAFDSSPASADSPADSDDSIVAAIGSPAPGATSSASMDAVAPRSPAAVAESSAAGESSSPAESSSTAEFSAAPESSAVDESSAATRVDSPAAPDDALAPGGESAENSTSGERGRSDAPVPRHDTTLFEAVGASVDAVPERAESSSPTASSGTAAAPRADAATPAANPRTTRDGAAEAAEARSDGPAPVSAPRDEPAPKTATAERARFAGEPEPVPPPDYDGWMEDESPVPPFDVSFDAPAAAPASSRVSEIAQSAPSAARPAAPAPRADAPVSPPEQGAGGDQSPIDGARLRRAWNGMLQEGDGLPAGMSFMLRAAQVSAEGRSVRLALAPGSPALERLSDASARRRIEQALAKRLGGAVTLELATGAAAAIDPAKGRITAESARQDRLRRLMDGEPVLAAAVQAWDLELVE